MARQLTFAGNGTLKTWIEPANLQGMISDGLRAAGYDVTAVIVENVPQLTVASILTTIAVPVPITWNYKISITCNSPDDENPERVRQVFSDYLTNWFDNVGISLAYDSGASFLGNIANIFSGGTNAGGNAKNNASAILPYILVGGAIILGFTFISGRASSGSYRRR